MTKPILWLGPLDELDADYDPLLGRSAAQAQIVPKSGSPKPRFDPSRSVFDDPLEIKPTAPTHISQFDDTTTYQDLTADDLVAAALPVTVTEVPTEEVPSEQLQVTDFTHNNDPILPRHETAPAVETPTRQNQSDESEVDAGAASVKRSFFATLFSKREIPVAAANRSASINEIWAKAEAEPEPAQEPAQQTNNSNTAPTEDAHDGAAITPSKPEPGRNIWTDIDKELEDETASATPFAPEEATQMVLDTTSDVDADEASGGDVKTDGEIGAVGGTSGDHEQIDTGESIIPADQVDLTIPTLLPIEPEPDSLPVQESLSETIVEPEVQTVLEAETEDADTEVDLGFQPESQPDTNAESAPELLPEATSAPAPKYAPTPDFRGAFNANKFWSLSNGNGKPGVAATPATPPRSADDDIDTPAPIDESRLEETPMSQSQDRLEATYDDQLDEPAPQTSDSDVLAFAPPSQVPPRVAPATASPPPKRRDPKVAGRRGKKKGRRHYIGAFCGTFLFGVALLMTIVSSLAAFGYPFDMVSSYRWYWIFLAVLAAAIWGITRGWKMVLASFAVMGANLFVTMPASGSAPTGGNTATAVVGWANVAGNADALARVFKDADRKKATLLMLAEAPATVLSPPAGWKLIEAPVQGDPTAIAVLSKSSWRAVTVPGEPTMARPPAGDLTIIGVHPQGSQKSRRRTPMRDSLINRAGTRAGIQDGPTVVLGDFDTAPWDHAMRQFKDYGNVTRVRCGGWAGSTFTQAFGLIGIATDHAYVRDVKVTHCQLGRSLQGGNHKPIWLYVAP